MLDKVELNLSLSSGIDTKTDSKIVEGRLLTLENAEIRNGIVVKSTGYDSLDPSYPSNSTTSNKALIPVGNSVALVDDDKMGIYNTASSKFNYIDSFGSCGKDVVTVESNIQDNSRSTDGKAPIIRSVVSGESSKYIVTITTKYITYTSQDVDITARHVISVVDKSSMTVIKKYLKVARYAASGEYDPIGVCCTDTLFAMYSYMINNSGKRVILEDVYDYSKDTPVVENNVVLNVPTPTILDRVMDVTNIDDIAYIVFNTTVGGTDRVPAVHIREFSTQTTIVSANTYPQLAFDTASTEPDAATSINIRVFNVTGRGNMVAINAGKTFILLDPAAPFTLWKSFAYPTVLNMPVVAIGYLSATNEFVTLKSLTREDLTSYTARNRIPVVNRYNLTTNSWSFSGDVSRTKTVVINGVSTQVVSNYFGYDANTQLGVCFALNFLICTAKKAYYVQKYSPYISLNSATGYSTPTYPITTPTNDPDSDDSTPWAEIRTSLFLLDQDYTVCDRFVEYTGAAFLNTRGYRCNTSTLGLNSTTVSYPLITGVLSTSSTGGEAKFSYDIRLHRLSYETNFPIRTGRINNATMISSPSLFEINNNQVTENNFYDFPQITAGVSSVAGALTGSYTFKAIYEHTDGSGNTVRSSESIAKQITLASNNAIIGITVPPWFSKRQNQKIKVYTTQTNGNSFNLVGTLFQLMRPVTLPDNFATTWLWSPMDTLQIAALNYNDTNVTAASKREIIYTSGGILPAFPLPSAITNVVHNNRVFCVPHYNKNLIRYTKPAQVGIATESFLGLDIIIESRGGDIVELASLDEKLIVFKKNSIYGIQGDGVDASGNGSTFSVPYLINSPVGCSEPLSVVRIPDGIMFKSTNGIYLLNRSVTVSYIGAPVEKFNNEKIVSSVIIETENKVKFTTNAGNVLTYDYYYGVWYTESNLAFVGTSLIQGKFCGVFNTGKVWLNNPTSCLRDGAQYTMKVQTAWLKLKGLQGYARAYRIYLLGDYKDTHSINIDVSYDYNETVAHTVNYVPVSNSPSQPIQARVNFERQKCQSVRLTFTDVSTGTTGNSLTMTDLSILAGVKRGFNKVSPSQTTSV